MQTVIDESLVNYEVYSPKNQQTILVLHGWGRSKEEWQNFAKYFSAKFKVILIDLPGFGDSPKPSDTADTYWYSALIKKFIDKLKLDNLTVLGHSFGGKITLAGIHESDKVKKIILLDSSGVENRTFQTRLSILFFKFGKKLVKILPFPNKNQLLAKYINSFYKTNTKMRIILKNVTNQNFSEAAKKITKPTTIVWGDNDLTVSIQNAQRLKSLIPNSTLRIVWGASHFPHLEKPTKFLEIMEEILS